MKPAAMLLALSLIAPLLAGQDTPAPAPASGTIEGTVVNGATGEPLKKVSVTLRRTLSSAEVRLRRRGLSGADPNQSVATDSTGRFVFSHLDPGEYNLWANRAGFVGEGYRGRGPGAYETLHLAPGADVNDIHFKLMPGGVISGKVVDEDGDPVIGASVQALRYTWQSGERQLDAFGGANTNDLGEYRIFDLMPGQYCVRALYQDQDTGDEVYAPVYYPQTHDPAAATFLDLKAANEVDDTDFTLLPMRSVHVRGQVVPPDGAGAEGGLNVMLMSRDGANGGDVGHPTQIGPSDTFDIRGVTPGSYVLFAMWFPGAGRGGVRAYDRSEQLTGRTVIDVADADVNGITLPVGPGSTIAGQTVAASGALPSGLHVMLEPREPPMMGTPGAPVGRDGKFVLQAVPDGVYRVRLAGLQGSSYLKSATLGGQDALDSNITVSQESPPGNLSLVIDPQGGAVEGTVSNDEKPYGSATVVLVPDAPQRGRERLYRVARADDSGHFAMNGIVPGDYKVFAWDEVDGAAYLDPAFLSLYDSRGTELHINPDASANVQTELLATSN